MDFNYFDLVISVIILLLGLKGILNGFFKELFGLIGIIGGIFVASRVSGEVGAFLNDNIFHFESPSLISFSGFLLTLALFWLAMVGIGHLFKRLGAASGLGALDRIAGFVFGSGKFFFIAAVIAYALNNVVTIRENIREPLEGSILFPILVETGSYIMHLDTESLQPKETAPKPETNDSAISIERAGEIIETVKSQLKEQTP
ncbi:CvpA family protein [Sulfurimonas sp. HSL1-2]|uniref:CvpA family protein n=1 Tax=Thiomicrolovo zhangzhouensis TaxID=3131933 RepID=UPI0031F94A24